jgi:hypothetical protein
MCLLVAGRFWKGLKVQAMPIGLLAASLITDVCAVMLVLEARGHAEIGNILETPGEGSVAATCGSPLAFRSVA